MLGEVMYTEKSTAAIHGIEEEDGVEGRSTGRPGLRELSRRKRRSWRSFRTRREVEGEAVATVSRRRALGDELRSVGERGSQRRGEEGVGESERPGGVRGALG